MSTEPTGLSTATLLWDPLVEATIVDLGFTSIAARRWLKIGDRMRLSTRTLGEYLDIDDDDLLYTTNFGVVCLEITHSLRDLLGRETQ